MRGSRNCRQGGGPSDRTNSDNVFLGGGDGGPHTHTRSGSVRDKI